MFNNNNRKTYSLCVLASMYLVSQMSYAAELPGSPELPVFTEVPVITEIQNNDQSTTEVISPEETSNETESTNQENDDPARGIKKKRPGPAEEIIEITPALIVEEAPVDTGPVLPKRVPSLKTDGQISQIQNIDVKKVDILGLTVFSRNQLSSLLAMVEGKTITFETLNNLRHKLSQLYLNQGYINSGVIIPDQKVEKGIVTLKVIEGELTTIEVEGLGSLDKAYVENTIQNIVTTPLNINELSEALKLLNQDKLIKQVNARLLPGQELGQSTLRLAVIEDDPFYYSLGLDNYLSPSVGAERIFINAGHANVFGYADQLDVNLDFTEGLLGSNAFYVIPFNQAGTSLKLYGDYRDYIAVEEPFDQIDIESTSYQYGFTITHPLKRRINEELYTSIGFEVKHSESTLLTQPFSFSLGAINGESDVSVLNTSLNWVKRNPTNVFSFNGALRLGLLALDATENEGDLPDGEFTLIKGQLQYAQLLGYADSQLLFRSGFQFAFDPLLSMEKFAVGGRYSVRGYRENQFVRDNGITATLEWRVPLAISEDNRYEVQVVPFFDVGSSWDKDESLAEKYKTTKESISSLGVGLLWDPTPNWHAELFYAYALEDLPEVSNPDLQDNGIHFQISYKSVK